MFFPQRPVLRIDGHAYSSTILHRILHMAAASSSFDQAEVSLRVVGELSISDRQINKLATETGSQLAAQRDGQTDAWVAQGLPVTSSLAESLVKQISKRVKGTKMFWNAGPSGEAILQLRAALISDGDRFADWIATCPISPFSPRCRSSPLSIAG